MAVEVLIACSCMQLLEATLQSRTDCTGVYIIGSSFHSPVLFLVVTTACANHCISFALPDQGYYSNTHATIDGCGVRSVVSTVADGLLL